VFELLFEPAFEGELKKWTGAVFRRDFKQRVDARFNRMFA